MQDQPVVYSLRAHGHELHVALDGTTLEYYDQPFGKKRVIMSCGTADITRIVSVHIGSEAAKHTIFFSDAKGDEKRFGGIGYSLMGTMADPTFAELVGRLKERVPETLWQTAEPPSTVKTASDNSLIYPIATEFFGGKGISPDSLGKVLAYFFSGVLFVMGGVALTALAGDQNLAYKLFLASWGVLLIVPSLAPLSMLFRGGMFRAKVSDDALAVNKAVTTQSFPWRDIETITATKETVKITLRKPDRTIIAVVIEVVINNRYDFRLDEGTGEKFLEELERRGVAVERITKSE